MESLRKNTLSPGNNGRIEGQFQQAVTKRAGAFDLLPVMVADNFHYGAGGISAFY